jgi:phosphoserine phosphatase
MRLQEPVTLHETIRLVNETLDLPLLLRAIENAACSLLGCEEASVRLVDEAEGVQPRCPNALFIPIVARDQRLLGVFEARGCEASAEEDMAQALAALAGLAIKRHYLLRDAAERRRLEQEMEVAREVLYDLLPRQRLKAGAFELASWFQPGDWVGGDCLDYFLLAEDRLVFLLADASGHGLGPTLIAAECRALWRVLVTDLDLGDVVGRLNRMLEADTADDRFVTACFGTVDTATGNVEYVCAGQGPLLHAQASGVAVLPPSGPPLGVTLDPQFPLRVDRLLLSPGDLLVVTSDGILDWRRPDGRMFGEERLSESIGARRGADAAAVVDGVRCDLDGFRQSSPQRDDVSLIVIRRTT